MARYRIDADDAEQFRRIKDLVEGRAAVLLVSDDLHFLATGDLPADLERDLRAIGAGIAPDVTYDLERSASPPATTVPTPRTALLARLRGQPARGLRWTREELYEAGP